MNPDCPIDLLVASEEKTESLKILLKGLKFSAEKLDGTQIFVNGGRTTKTDGCHSQRC